MKALITLVFTFFFANILVAQEVKQSTTEFEKAGKHAKLAGDTEVLETESSKSYLKKTEKANSEKATVLDSSKVIINERKEYEK